MERHNNNNAIAMPNNRRILTIMRHSHNDSERQLRGKGATWVGWCRRRQSAEGCLFYSNGRVGW